VVGTFVIRDVIAATPRAKLVQVDVGDAPFDYQAGQAVLVAPHGAPWRRPYSIASAPEDAKRSGVIDLLVGTDSVPGEPVFDPVAGASVDVEGPVGSFTFPAAPAQRGFLFIAGGTGIAPLRAMIRHALGTPHDRIALVYSARTPDEFAFGAEFRALADAGAMASRQTVTRGDGHPWPGARGRVAIDSLRGLIADGETLCFVCGPASMVADVPKLLLDLGIRQELIRIEEW
jgi:ferredoxin-NADP reductase